MRRQPQLHFKVIPVSDAIQALLGEPAVELVLDMGLGSREQNMPSAPPKRACFILSEQAQPCLHEAAPL